jgi:hypothetical protein
MDDTGCVSATHLLPRLRTILLLPKKEVIKAGPRSQGPKGRTQDTLTMNGPSRRLHARKPGIASKYLSWAIERGRTLRNCQQTCYPNTKNSSLFFLLSQPFPLRFSFPAACSSQVVSETPTLGIDRSPLHFTPSIARIPPELVGLTRIRSVSCSSNWGFRNSVPGIVICGVRARSRSCLPRSLYLPTA